MKPVTINITNLIGTLVIIGDKQSASAQIKTTVNDALLKVLKTATEAKIDPSRAESCNTKTDK
jgi:hypothetical protein